MFVLCFVMHQIIHAAPVTDSVSPDCNMVYEEDNTVPQERPSFSNNNNSSVLTQSTSLATVSQENNDQDDKKTHDFIISIVMLVKVIDVELQEKVKGQVCDKIIKKMNKYWKFLFKNVPERLGNYICDELAEDSRILKFDTLMLAIKSNIDAKYICEADETQKKDDGNTISLVSTKLHKVLANHGITNLQDLEPKAIVDFISEISQDISEKSLEKITSDILYPKIFAALTEKELLDNIFDSLFENVKQLIIEEAHEVIKESLQNFVDKKIQPAHAKSGESIDSEKNERDSDQLNAADDIKRRRVE